MSFLKDKSLSNMPTVYGLKTSWNDNGGVILDITSHFSKIHMQYLIIATISILLDAVEVEAIRIDENPPRYKGYNNGESFMSGETEAIVKNLKSDPKHPNR
ncbi:hypothetical protein HID58_054031 [Brassica napus]|uniref:Uncharacterized protein n=1 Tax=Brassica napus TaxID=3708 RepID=A0ABQ8AGC5_BRANA|nr:hypothetical protein HID58_054031 [Brassica napus]